jgi:hypothetical protein
MKSLSELMVKIMYKSAVKERQLPKQDFSVPSMLSEKNIQKFDVDTH